MKWYLSFLSLLLSPALSATAPYVPGTVPSTPVALTRDNFDQALRDPATPLWYLKFYAPWCGHCKALAPVLDQVAPHLQGQLAIGTIDCTVQKALCDAQAVRGYPTIKFAVDGEIHEYPTAGRTAADIAAFAAKFRHPAVRTVASYQETIDFLQTEEVEDGVAFVAFHPNANRGAKEEEEEASSSLEDRLQTALLTQIYQQVARRMMAFSHFLLYQGLDPQGDFGRSGPFLCRVEKDVPLRCYDKWDKDLTLENVLGFCRENHLPTVARLSSHNFQKVGRNGRPLVIGVVDTEHKEQVETAKRKLTSYALTGPAKSRDKYYYGWMDGKQFQKFLKQFDIEPSELPQVFALDVPHKKYWQNSTFKLNVEDFVAAVENKSLPYQTAGKKGLEGAVERFMSAMMKYHPWSVGALVIFIAVFLIMVLSIVSPAQELQPPYKQSRPVSSDTASAEPSPATDERDDAGKDDETKKDK